jgi:hypothetical protein
MRQRPLTDGIGGGCGFIALIITTATHWYSIRYHLLQRPVSAIAMGLLLFSGALLWDLFVGRRSFRG